MHSIIFRARNINELIVHTATVRFFPAPRSAFRVSTQSWMWRRPPECFERHRLGGTKLLNLFTFVAYILRLAERYYVATRVPGSAMGASAQQPGSHPPQSTFVFNSHHTAARLVPKALDLESRGSRGLEIPPMGRSTKVRPKLASVIRTMVRYFLHFQWFVSV
jgi:hypothetical protein